jgi:hypothetical protein
VNLKAKLRRWTLILGVVQVTFGCIVGFIPRTAVPWFRGIVMAHIEFTANGVLVVVLGLLLSELELGTLALWVWFVTVQIGTWTNGAAGLVGAFIGYSSKLMPTINEKFPAPNGLDHPVTSGLLLVCGVTVLTALGLTLTGLVRESATAF